MTETVDIIFKLSKNLCKIYRTVSTREPYVSKKVNCSEERF